ncbi:hypothetical protein EVAR_101640_1 [Eumeta japonica]|uniref:Uncharacterized protein n=1 Tax=Eumeta variegata TaxID=151549 RepID=A0A4C2AAN9_EUMVA|nr:hypothetical protein EVAR_101640_1 [Eumeta japonica]
MVYLYAKDIRYARLKSLAGRRCDLTQHWEPTGSQFARKLFPVLEGPQHHFTTTTMLQPHSHFYRGWQSFSIGINLGLLYPHATDFTPRIELEEKSPKAGAWLPEGLVAQPIEAVLFYTT